jgi:hypothetical protein
MDPVSQAAGRPNLEEASAGSGDGHRQQQPADSLPIQARDLHRA